MCAIGLRSSQDAFVFDRYENKAKFIDTDHTSAQRGVGSPCAHENSPSEEKSRSWRYVNMKTMYVR